MAKVINCDDGYVVRGDTDEQLLANAQGHIREAHPEMVGNITDDELLAMAQEV